MKLFYNPKGCILFTFLFSFVTFTLSAYSPPKSGKENQAGQKNGLPYLTVSAGAGVWYLSNQMALDNRQMPLSFSIEYGRTSKPYSLIAAGFFRTTFTTDKFLLNPNNLFLGIQLAPLSRKPVSKKFNLYMAGGFNLAYSRFTEELYPGIINYENKVEKKVSLGLAAAAGMGYKIKFLEIKPMLYFFTGHSGFLAGHFTEQRYNTGSLQLHVTVSYKHIFNAYNRTCPVYRKYKRL